MMIKADFEKYDTRKRVRFINSLSGFKPVTLLGSIGLDMQENLAIVNSCVHLGANPPLMGIIFRPHTTPRHSLENILETKQFTLNHITEEFYTSAHQTSARYSREQSEFEVCNIENEYLEGSTAPFVKLSPLKISLEFVREVKIPENGTSMIIAEIKSVFVEDNFVSEDGYIDIEGLGILCGSSLDGYHKTESLGRMNYAKP